MRGKIINQEKYKRMKIEKNKQKKMKIRNKRKN